MRCPMWQRDRVPPYMDMGQVCGLDGFREGYRYEKAV